MEPCSDALRPRGGDLIQRKKTGKTRFTVEEKEEQLLPDLKPKPGTELRLSQLPEKHYPDGATPTEITKHSLDSSYVLDIVLDKLKQYDQHQLYYFFIIYIIYYLCNTINIHIYI